MLDILARQVASPVQFVKGLQTLFEAGARVFVEVGPKKRAAGLRRRRARRRRGARTCSPTTPSPATLPRSTRRCAGSTRPASAGRSAGRRRCAQGRRLPRHGRPRRVPALGQRIRGGPLAAGGRRATWSSATCSPSSSTAAAELWDGGGGGRPRRHGAGRDHGRGARASRHRARRSTTPTSPACSHGEQFIDVIPSHVRDEMLDKHITRLVKSDDGSAAFETIDSPHDVIKLAAPRRRASTSPRSSASTPTASPRSGATRSWRSAPGIDALRDAGIPLVHALQDDHASGTQLPDRWGLPDELRDDTGVIFASAFPGLDEFADEIDALLDRPRPPRAAATLRVAAGPPRRDRRATTGGARRDRPAHPRPARSSSRADPYAFDRRFLFRVLSMGHSQFAELIGARGPNTQVNAACASTTQAVARGRGLDPRRSLPARGRDRGRRRRHLRRAARLDRRRLPRHRRGGDRRGRRGGRAPVRPPPPRDDPRHGRRRARGRARRGGARARHAADLRGARRGHRQQRLPRHAARRRPHRRR